MGYLDTVRDSGNAVNKLVGGARTISNPESTPQQVEAAVVSMMSGVGNATTALTGIIGYEIPGLSLVNGLLNAANFGEKQALLEQAIASGDATSILIASLDYAAAVAGIAGAIPGPHSLEAKALALLLSSLVATLKNGDSISDLLNSNPLLNSGNIKWGDLDSDISIPRSRRITDDFNASRQFVQRRDPLALDLDGDGLETIGVTGSTVVLFDHDGDGTKTGTGWVQGDDAFLALDKNGNGLIDNGNELFGVDTVLANGQKATSGFAALADLDSNQDGQFSNLDAQFADVRVWRDLNQDGISQAGELQSLDEAGIASINLSSTATNITLAGGNVQSAAGSYTKTSGETGTAGEFTTGSTGNLDLASNPFYREFTDTVPLTAEAQSLPDLQGAGAVRDLKEAASLNAALVADINGLTGTSRSQMLSQLDGLIQHWADSADFQTSRERIAAMVDNPLGLPDITPRIVFSVPGMTSLELQIFQLDDQPYTEFAVALLKTTPGFDATHYDSMKAESERVAKMLDILETFNGQSFFDFPENGGVRMGNGQQFNLTDIGMTPDYAVSVSQVVSPVLSATHIQLLQQSYDALKQSVYEGLVLQTRLKGYLDAVSLTIDETGIKLDFSGMQGQLDLLWQTDRVSAFTDCLDLRALLSMGCDVSGKLTEWATDAANNGQLDSLKNGLATEFAESLSGVPDIKVGGA